MTRRVPNLRDLETTDPRIPDISLKKTVGPSLLQEAVTRRLEALQLFEPLPVQQQFLSSDVLERLVVGSNQCVVAGTRVITRRGMIPVEEIVIGDEVYGRSHVPSRRWQKVISTYQSSQPVRVFKLVTRRGYSIIGNAEHPIMVCGSKRNAWHNTVDADRNWRFETMANITTDHFVQIGPHTVSPDAWPQSSQIQPHDAYFLGLMTGDGWWRHRYGRMSLTTDVHEQAIISWLISYLRGYGIEPKVEPKSGSQGISIRWCDMDFKRMVQGWGVGLDTCHNKSIPECIWRGPKDIASAFMRGLFDADGCATENPSAVLVGVSANLMAGVHILLLRFGVRSSLRLMIREVYGKPANIYRLEIGGSNAAAFRKLIGFGLWRKQQKLPLRESVHAMINFDNVKCVAPVGQATIYGFCCEPDHVFYGNGIFCHNSGKTTIALVELAKAALGLLPGRYPARDGQAIVVGRSYAHIGATIWKKLGRAGAFYIVRDPVTKLWRPVKPGDDLTTRKLAPPLIPPRYIDSIAWYESKHGIPTLVRLKTGWEIRFYSSDGEPPQGMQADLALFDEEIMHLEWYPEIAARLIAKKGRFVWSVTPQNAGPVLAGLNDRAEEQAKLDKPSVARFFMHIEDNPHIGAEERKSFWDKLTDEQRRVRYHGQFALAGYLVYPEFSMDLHGVSHSELPDNQIPINWTRYMVVDPGHQICAVLFAAVPPPEFGDYVYVYDELYIPHCSADIFAEQVAEKAVGQSFAAFIIDYNAGKATEISTGRTREDHYSSALKERKVHSYLTGHGFVWGSNDVTGGLEAVRRWLRIRSGGTTKLRVLRGKCPKLEWEFRRYRNKVVRGLLTDKPEDRDNHLQDSLRYLAMYEPAWMPLPKPQPQEHYVHKALRLKLERRMAMYGDPYVRLGPGITQPRTSGF